jgi:DNA-damage-inducible protein J
LCYNEDISNKGLQMALNSVVRARVDKDLKDEVQVIFNELGINTSQAINIFLKKVALEKGMPFDLKVPNDRLQNAINEANNNQGTYHDNIDDMIKDLKS